LCVKELPHKILLGWDFMRYHGCTPDPTAGCLRMRQGNIPFPTSHAVVLVRAESLQSKLMAHHTAQEAMEKMLPCEQESSGKDRSALAGVRGRVVHVGRGPLADVVRHAIHIGDAKPMRCSLRRIPYHQRAQVEALLDEMLRRDAVEPSSSPWASSIVFVKKKDGSCQFCVDYRQLNNLKRKDAHPLLRIDDTLDALAGAQWFSILDPARGYWQVEVALQSVWEITPSACCSPPPAFRPEMNSVEGKEWLEDFLCVSRVPPSDHGVVAHYLLSDSFPREL
ncbi:Transposon Ty3-I Gag-Pol polyprotein, partial [Trichinella sp. T9]